MGKTRLTQPVFFRHLSTSDKAVRILTEAEGDDWLHRLTGFNGLWCFCWVQETRKSNHFFIWNLCVSSNTQPLFRMVTSCNTWISQLFATGITGNAVPCAVKRRGYGPQWFPWPLRWRPWGTTWEAAKVSMRTSRGAEADGNSAWNVCRMMGWLGQLGDKFDWRYIYIYMMHRWLYIRDLLEFPRFDSTSGAWLLCQAVERSTNSKTQSGAARLQGHRHGSTICTDALWLNHHPVCGGEHVQFLGLLFSRYSHDIPIIFPWYSYDIPMIFPWYSHDIPMIFPWYSNDIPMIFLLLFYDYYY